MSDYSAWTRGLESRAKIRGEEAKPANNGAPYVLIEKCKSGGELAIALSRQKQYVRAEMYWPHNDRRYHYFYKNRDKFDSHLKWESPDDPTKACRRVYYVLEYQDIDDASKQRAQHDWALSSIKLLREQFEVQEAQRSKLGSIHPC